MQGFADGRALLRNWIIGPVRIFVQAVIFLRDQPQGATGLVLIVLPLLFGMQGRLVNVGLRPVIQAVSLYFCLPFPQCILCAKRGNLRSGAQLAIAAGLQSFIAYASSRALAWDLQQAMRWLPDSAHGGVLLAQWPDRGGGGASG